MSSGMVDSVEGESLTKWSDNEDCVKADSGNSDSGNNADSGSADSPLNTTFEVDTHEENGAPSVSAAAAALDISEDINENDSLLTDDGKAEEEEQEKKKLNGTFEIIGDEVKDSGTGTVSKTKSGRLSVSGVTKAALNKETASSPAVRPSAAAARQIKVPNSRRSVAKTPKAPVRSSVSAVVQRLTTPSATKRKQPEESVSNIPRFVKFSRYGCNSPRYRYRVAESENLIILLTRARLNA
jgi:hypothetical protein